MLALDQPLGEVSGTVLYGDHADPDVVHVLPTRPRLATRDGRPEAAMVYLRPQDATEQGAALFSFTTTLPLDEDQQVAIRAHLEDRGRTEVVLAPVQWSGGRAVLSAALPEGGRFVERVLGDTPVGGGGDNRAVFSVLLTESGAALVEGLRSMEEGPSPLGVRYDLTYLGLRPALDVRVRADYGRVFDEFAAGFEIGVAYQGVGVRAGVETATRTLTENGAITVEVLHFTDDADFRARVDEAVTWLQERLLQDFFTSSLEPAGQEDLLEQAVAAAASLGAASLREALAEADTAARLAQRLGLPVETLRTLGAGAPGAGAGASGAAGAAGGATSTFALNLQFQLRDIREEERKVVELDWREAHAEERSASPQALLADLGAVPVITPAADSAAVWERLDVRVRPLGDFADLGVTRMDVRLAYPDEESPGAHQDTVTFTGGDDPSERFSAFTDGRPPAYRYRTQVQFQEAGPVPGPPLEDGPWRSGSAQELAVHPLAEVDLLDLEVTTDTLDLTEVPQVQVDLGVDGQHVISLTLTAATPSLRHRRRLPRMSPARGDVAGGADGMPDPGVLSRVTYRCTWFLAGGPRVVGEEASLTSPLLQVPGPWRGHRSVRVFPMLPEDVLEATVRLSLAGSPHQEVVFFGPESERRSVEVVLPSLQEQPPPAVVETFVLLASGEHFSSRVETEAPVVMVQAHHGAHRRVEVRLVAGEDLAAHGVSAVVVQLLDDSGLPVDSVTFTATEREPGELLVPLAPDGSAVPALVRVTRYRSDGVAVRAPVQQSLEDRLLVPAAIPPGAPDDPEPGVDLDPDPAGPPDDQDPDPDPVPAGPDDQDPDPGPVPAGPDDQDPDPDPDPQRDLGP